MAGNRIRYKDHPTRTNCLISINDYVSLRTGARYKLLLDLENMKFMIRNERSKEFSFTSKSYGNMNVLKRNARSKLESFGVNLSRESRDRTFGRCPEGMSQSQWERLSDEQREKIKEKYNVG
jgi:hypothetical protein